MKTLYIAEVIVTDEAIAFSDIFQIEECSFDLTAARKALENCYAHNTDKERSHREYRIVGYTYPEDEDFYDWMSNNDPDYYEYPFEKED